VYWVLTARLADGVKVATDVEAAKVTFPVTAAPPAAAKVNVEELIVDGFID
jgi:hypothetical protein